MLALPVIIALVIPFVAAQSTPNDTTVQIEAIEAHFTQADIVPALLATFDPSALLAINFDGRSMHFSPFFEILTMYERCWRCISRSSTQSRPSVVLAVRYTKLTLVIFRGLADPYPHDHARKLFCGSHRKFHAGHGRCRHRWI